MSRQIIRSVKYNILSSNEGHDSENVLLFETEPNYPKKETIKIKKVLMMIGILATIATIVSIIAIISSQNGPINVPSNQSNYANFTAIFSTFSSKTKEYLPITLIFLRKKKK